MAVYIDYADMESVDVKESTSISPNRCFRPLNIDQEPCIVIDDDDTEDTKKCEIQNNVISSMQSRASEDNNEDCLIVGISQNGGGSSNDNFTPPPVPATKSGNRISEYRHGGDGKAVNVAIPTGIYSNFGANDGLPHAAQPSQSHSISAKKFYCLECRSVCSEDHEHGRPEAEIPLPKPKNRKYPCSICGKMYTNLNEYLQHCQVCEVYTKCSQCEEVFADTKLLEEHVSNIHDRKTRYLIPSTIEEVACSSASASAVVNKTESEFEVVSSSSSGLFDSSLSYLCPYCNAVVHGGGAFDMHIRDHDPHVTEIKLEQLRYHTQILNSGGLQVNVEDLNKGKQGSKRKTSDQTKTGGKNRKVARTKPETKSNKTQKAVASNASKNQSKAKTKSDEEESRKESTDLTSPKKSRRSEKRKASATNKRELLRDCSTIYTSRGKMHKCIDCGYKCKEFALFFSHVQENGCYGAYAKPRTYNPKKKEEDGYQKCKHCNRKFLYLYNLERHSSVHAKKTQMKCSVCFVIFSSIADLKNHTKKFHKEKGTKV